MVQKHTNRCRETGELLGGSEAHLQCRETRELLGGSEAHQQVQRDKGTTRWFRSTLTGAERQGNY